MKETNTKVNEMTTKVEIRKEIIKHQAEAMDCIADGMFHVAIFEAQECIRLAKEIGDM